MMAQGSPGIKLRKGMMSHGRGHRVEAGFLLRKSRDDDLILFTEMQKHETAKGEEGERNEYNWLLTPPATPLISLDGDGARPVNTSRAMRRTQTNSIPRQLMNEKTQRTSSSLNSSLAPKSNSTSSRPSTPTLQSMRKGTSPVKSSSSPKLRSRPSTPPSASKRPNSSQSRVKQHVKASACDDDADSSRKADGAFKQTGGVQDKVKKRSSKCGFKHEKTCEETNLSVADKTFIEKAGLGQDTSYPKLASPEFYFHLLASPVADNSNDEKSKKCDEVFFQNDRNGILDCSSIEDNHLQDAVGRQDSSLGAATQNSSNLILEQQAEHCFQDSQDTSNCAEDRPCKANVTAEALRKRTHKNTTMEETTDNIIFCSSIAHELAYKVASIVIEKEMPAKEASRPTILHLAKSPSYQKNFRDIYYKRIKYSRKLKKKRQEIDSKKAFKELGTNNARNKELAFSDDIMKAPKLEAKCNCTVM